MTQVALSVENLCVSYSTPGGRNLAVKGISFYVKPGETFGLVGESGSGKTTTAIAILRLIKPPARIEGGRVLLDGVDLLTLSDEELRRLRWSKLSLIPQGAMNSLNPVMRVKDQIADAILTHEGHGSLASLRERIIELLGTVGLPPRVYEMFPHELSGGMKQRVCIAMAIALRPQLIIADEPTSALDVVVQRRVAETLSEVQTRLNAAMILIGHDMGLQAQIADRLAVMYAGRLVEVGPVRAMFKNPLHPYTQQLIASIPSIKQPRTEHVTRRVWETHHTADDEAIPLREYEPEHWVALADGALSSFPFVERAPVIASTMGEG